MTTSPAATLASALSWIQETQSYVESIQDAPAEVASLLACLKAVSIAIQDCSSLFESPALKTFAQFQLYGIVLPPLKECRRIAGHVQNILRSHVRSSGDSDARAWKTASDPEQREHRVFDAARITAMTENLARCEGRLSVAVKVANIFIHQDSDTQETTNEGTKQDNAAPPPPYKVSDDDGDCQNLERSVTDWILIDDEDSVNLTPKVKEPDTQTHIADEAKSAEQTSDQLSAPSKGDEQLQYTNVSYDMPIRIEPHKHTIKTTRALRKQLDKSQLLHLDHNLWVAVKCGDNIGHIRNLINAGADVNSSFSPSAWSAGSKKDYKNVTSVLGYEIMLGRRPDVLELLFQHDVDPNSIVDGSGPVLSYAAYSGYIDIVKRLLVQGANPNEEGEKHDTAMDAAKDSWNETNKAAIVQVLQDWTPGHW